MVAGCERCADGALRAAGAECTVGDCEVCVGVLRAWDQPLLSPERVEAGGATVTLGAGGAAGTAGAVEVRVRVSRFCCDQPWWLEERLLAGTEFVTTGAGLVTTGAAGRGVGA